MASDLLAGLGRIAIAAPLLGASTIASPAHAAPPAASCTIDDSISPTGSNLWDGLIGQAIVLTMHDGSERIGLVVGQSNETLAFARVGDGELISVEKREIAGVRVSTPVTVRTEKDGRGRRIAGVMLSTLGSAAAFTGTLWLIVDPWGLYGSLPLLFSGGTLAGGGAGLLKAGKRRKAEYERSWGIARARLTPSLMLGHEGGQVGLTLRF